jgi:hypothetical protein
MELPGEWLVITACRFDCMPANPDWPHESEMKKFGLTLIADNFYHRSF